MLKAKCLEKIKDGASIIGYKLIDQYGTVLTCKASAIKEAIKNGSIDVVNLQLTSDNRLISKKMNQENKVIQKITIGRNIMTQVEALIDTSKYILEFKQVKDLKKAIAKAASLGIQARNLNESVSIIINNDRATIFSSVGMQLINDETFKSMKFKELRLNNIDVSGCETLKNMFDGTVCDVLDISDCDFSNITDATEAFARCNIKRVITDGLKLDKLTKIAKMFNHSEIGDIDITKFGFCNTIIADEAFSNSNIKTIEFAKHSFCKTTRATYMFYGLTCEKLDMTNLELNPSIHQYGILTYIRANKFILPKGSRLIQYIDNITTDTPLIINGTVDLALTNSSNSFMNGLQAPKIIIEKLQVINGDIIENSFNRINTFELDLRGFESDNIKYIDGSFEKINIPKNVSYSNLYNNTETIIKLGDNLERLVKSVKNLKNTITAIGTVRDTSDPLKASFNKPVGYRLVSRTGKVVDVASTTIKDIMTKRKDVTFTNLRIIKGKVTCTDRDSILLTKQIIALVDSKLQYLKYNYGSALGLNLSYDEYSELGLDKEIELRFKTLDSLPKESKNTFTILKTQDNIMAHIKNGVVTLLSDKQFRIECNGDTNSKEVLNVDSRYSTKYSIIRLGGINFSDCTSLSGLIKGTIRNQLYIDFTDTQLNNVINLDTMIDVLVNRNINDSIVPGLTINLHNCNLKNVAKYNMVVLDTYNIPWELWGRKKSFRGVPKIEFTTVPTNEVKPNVLTIIVGDNSKCIIERYNRIYKSILEHIGYELQ